MARNALTQRQEVFVAEYLRDFNGTQAAIRAGYSKRSARVQATENLAKPAIQQALHFSPEGSGTGISVVCARRAGFAPICTPAAK